MTAVARDVVVRVAAGSAVAAIMAEAVRVAGQGRWGRVGGLVAVATAAETAGAVTVVAREAEVRAAEKVEGAKEEESRGGGYAG